MIAITTINSTSVNPRPGVFVNLTVLMVASAPLDRAARLRGVGEALAAAHLRFFLGEIRRCAAKLRHGRLESHARARGFIHEEQHLKAADPQRLAREVQPFVLERGEVSEAMWNEAGEERLARGVVLLRDRCETLPALAEVMTILFPVSLKVEEGVPLDAAKKELVRAIIDALEGLDPFTQKSVEQAMREALAARGAALKDVAHACRVAVTGRGVGPSLFEILSVVGRDLVLARLRGLVGAEKM
jgi:hypothetical protein